MDMGGNDDNVTALTTRFPHARVVRYYDNHLDTLKRCISRCRTPYAWVISSVCDYADFDFDYRARPWESTQLHCWASGAEKFGDTFLINIIEFEKQKDIELLEWYKDVNWHTPGVPRLDPPVVTYTSDDLIDVVKATKFNTPYILFKRDVDSTPNFEPILWRDRSVHTFNRANSVSLVPREISAHLQHQIYDFPYIIKQKDKFLGANPLDIIYISNGEPNAEQWYNHLLTTVGKGNHTNWIRRVKDIDGRVNAYRAAAEASQTDWFFAVFAKLEVVDSFDWAWQPDYLQEPKHYIFNSHNPVNGLEYGHMGVIAYNRRLTLETNETGLDFTLTKAHSVVPVLSAVAHYNTTPELTWRTAFREVLKLKDDEVKTRSIETTYRLKSWLYKAEGAHSEWSLYGAHDAIEYYDSVEGDYSKLMLSFEWAWLKEYWAKKYS
jgi:hypothetical protein